MKKILDLISKEVQAALGAAGFAALWGLVRVTTRRVLC